MPHRRPGRLGGRPSPGRHIPVGDTRLWIEEEGAGEPVLLLAGGPASSHVVFHPVFGPLAESHRVIYLDYRGRGRSEPVEDPRTITFAGDVADVADLIRALGLGPVHVYGFSYGGMVAQALALDHPELVKRLVLANTLHSPEMWQRNHENINRELELQYPEVWDQILVFRDQGVPSTHPRVQQLYAVHSRLCRFYDPENAARVPSEPGSKNAALYPVFAGEDVEFFIGGEVARLPDFRPRLHELAHAGPDPGRAGTIVRSARSTSSTSSAARHRRSSAGWSGAGRSLTSRSRRR